MILMKKLKMTLALVAISMGLASCGSNAESQHVTGDLPRQVIINDK